MNELSSQEYHRLIACEATIEKGLNTFVDVGNALLEIRGSKLYRIEFDTFEDYCRERWRITRMRASQLISAAEVVANVNYSLHRPTHETQVRPLAPLEPQEQRQIWDAVTADNQHPTEKQVRATVENFKRAEVPKKPATFNEVNENIGWARWSWNPVTGCLHNCDYCYARDIANRFYPEKFEPTFHPERLDAPANTKVPASANGDPEWQRVFTCSMADLFGKWVPQKWIKAVFSQIEAHQEWEFLCLTKFPQRLAELDWPTNVWAGTTVDIQSRVANAERSFAKLKAGVKWLSCEPLLEPLRFTSLEMFDWVVIGASTGSSLANPFAPPFEWVVDLYNQARASGCRVYLKHNLFSSAEGREPGMRPVREWPERK